MVSLGFLGSFKPPVGGPLPDRPSSTSAIIAAMVARINLLGLAQPTHHVDTIPIHQGMNQVNAVRANAEYWVNHGFAGVALNGLYPPRLEFCTVTSDF